MGTIVITTNVSLDGVIQDPDGQEGFRLGGWFGQFGGKDLEEWARVETEEALGAQALLVGRRSDEWFATRWASRSGEWADRLNSLPKYVVSSTLEHPHWANATLVKGTTSSTKSRSSSGTSTEKSIASTRSYQLVRTTDRTPRPSST